MSKTHKNAVLTPTGRLAMVESAMAEENTLVDVAIWFNVTPQSVREWVNRYKKEGEAGLQDRSSRPHNSPNESLSEIFVNKVYNCVRPTQCRRLLYGISVD